MTSLNNAFDFDSTIIDHLSKPTYSPTCIFCLNTETICLLPDGSFRQCLKCRKQFKSNIIPNTLKVPQFLNNILQNNPQHNYQLQHNKK